MDDATTTAGSGYYKGMAVFTVAKGGLMYEASIGGQKFSYMPKQEVASDGLPGFCFH
jgi:hypothetical protein